MTLPFLAAGSASKSFGTSATNRNLFVGDSGTGLLTVQNGGKVSNTTGTIGNSIGSHGTVLVDGAGSTWANTGTATFFFSSDHYRSGVENCRIGEAART